MHHTPIIQPLYWSSYRLKELADDIARLKVELPERHFAGGYPHRKPLAG